ncbi:MAG TPA: ribosome biogenesis GTPase Der [Acidimicrobiales bacterium]|jgi:GTP-binding protein|nr:ribosome biogenesis GTPase Der [Acidimicrobiales bacterium]
MTTSLPEATPDVTTETVRKKPLVVIAGRPNVGKSTLVNRIVGRRAAVVEERSGVTRDRKELDAEWCGHAFTVVDTGGWLSTDDPLDAQVSAQAERAVADADVVLLVVDVTVGLIDEDVAVAKFLKRSGRPVRVVVNKVDSSQRESDAWEAVSLGLGDPWPVSALHGRGTGDLLDDVVGLLPDLDPVDAAPEPGADTGEDSGGRQGSGPMIPRVALVGRPNVGKSTLFNRLVGDERSITHDAPGTTRDAVDTVVETPEGTVCFIDTAGMRRKSRTERGTEYFSVLRALEALDRADIALLIIDATLGVTHQDQRLAERVGAAGCPTVVVLNKWELIPTEERSDILTDIGDRLAFLGDAPVLKISALSGLGVHQILPAVASAEQAYHSRIPTGELNRAMKSIQMAHPPVGAKIQYAVQGASEPPTFTLFTNGRLQPTYLRYVERGLRERFELGPTPIKLRVRAKGPNGGGGRRR